jgi:hypothetical protein
MPARYNGVQDGVGPIHPVSCPLSVSVQLPRISQSGTAVTRSAEHDRNAPSVVERHRMGQARAGPMFCRWIQRLPSNCQGIFVRPPPKSMTPSPTATCPLFTTSLGDEKSVRQARHHSGRPDCRRRSPDPIEVTLQLSKH